jgi:hypothetical protein
LFFSWQENSRENAEKNKNFKKPFCMIEIKIIREKCKAKVETNG